MSSHENSPVGPYVRFSLLVAFAATLAYAVGNSLPHTSGLIASITALITIQPTLHKSMKETVWQVAGLLIGVLTVVVITKTFGFSPFMLFGAILFGYLIARLMHVDASAAPAVVVPIVIIVGTTLLSTETVLQRAYGALLGAAIAIAVSLIVHPGSPSKRALNGAVSCADEIAVVLQKMATTLRLGIPSEENSTALLHDMEKIQVRLKVLREEAEDAHNSVRWSPLLDETETSEALTQVKITQATVDASINMCRDLLVASRHAVRVSQLPPELAQSLSGVVSRTAGMIKGQASRVGEERSAHALPVGHPESEAASNAVRESIAYVKDVESTGAILIGSSLIRDSEKISALLTEPTPEPRKGRPGSLIRKKKQK